MGTRGSGNFESDGALDYVGELMNQLVEKIEAGFTDSRTNLDEEGEAVLMPSVQILSILHEHCNAAPPETQVISE